MKSWQQALAGILMALLSGLIILGSLSLSLAESGFQLALSFTDTPTMWTPILVSAEPGLPLAPGTATLTPTITATFTPDADCPAPPGWVPVPVGQDDSLDMIANRYGISKDELKQGNCLVVDTIKPSFLYVPQQKPTPSPTPTRTPQPIVAPSCVVSNPGGWMSYIVKSGDTFYSLAIRFGTQTSELMRVNCYTSTDLLTGAFLLVPWTPTPTFTRTPFWTVTITPVYTWLPTGTSTILLVTRTPTGTPTITLTGTPSATASSTPTPTTTGTLLPPTSTSTPVPSSTPTPTNTSTSTNQPPTDTPTPSVTPLAPSSLE